MKRLALAIGLLLMHLREQDGWTEEFSREEREHLYRAREILLAHQPSV